MTQRKQLNDAIERNLIGQSFFFFDPPFELGFESDFVVESDLDSDFVSDLLESVLESFDPPSAAFLSLSADFLYDSLR